MARANACPDDTVEGNLGETTANPAPDTCAELTVTDEPDTDSITFCVVVAPTCVGPKLIVALFEVIIPTIGGPDLLPVTPLEHPVISTTDSVKTETIEFALFDQRFIRLTMRHHPTRRGFRALRSPEARR